MISGIAAGLLASVLLALAALHLYWARGGTWGWSVVLPERPDGGGRVISPGPILTAVVAFFLALAALLVLGAAGFLSLPVAPRFLRFAVSVLGIVLMLRAVGDFRWVGFCKRVRGTRFAFWDDRLFSPLCLVLGGLAALVVSRP